MAILLSTAFLPLNASLLSPFMCLEIGIFATILVISWGVTDSAAAFMCDSYELESLLVGYLDQGSIHQRSLVHLGYNFF